jgi:hypothetical protein
MGFAAISCSMVSFVFLENVRHANLQAYPPPGITSVAHRS